MMKHTFRPLQLELPIAHAEVDGVGMGVLSDGTPYLTARGLARMCGQAPSVVIDLTTGWAGEQRKPRGRKIARLLDAHGHRDDALFVQVQLDGRLVHAHPDAVCMAILEYYAFEADTRARPHAQASFRMLARHSLRQFIYRRVGYVPADRAPDAWKLYHERLMLNDFPVGHFSVFHEISDIIISAIRSGLLVDSSTLPDVSVGQRWSRYWTTGGLAELYGTRRKHPHRFPDEFRQSSVVDAWVYPIEALGEFRLWMKNEYLPRRFPGYLSRKVERGVLTELQVDHLLAAVNRTLVAAPPAPPAGDGSVARTGIVQVTEWTPRTASPAVTAARD